MLKKELLVPVGNIECLYAAINNGADAVYLAGKKYGARAFANNFFDNELEDIIKLCHLYGVKVYITVNTLIYENEFEDVLEYIEKIHKYGVDAIIMQDIGLINVVHQKYPNLELHASTQMHNHAKENIEFLKTLGVKRVVFARELSLDYIDKLDNSIEKEVFIHGSLCVSYSGQCYFSKEILDRSANRGECAGMCRLPYEIYQDNKKINTFGKYLLSPKDLCSIDNFKRVMASSAYSLKIEGRMKSPLYVATVTKIYRKLIDDYNKGLELKVSKIDLDLLKASFYRGYTQGYLLNEDNIMNYERPNHDGLYVGKVINVTDKKIKIKLDKEIKQGEGIRFKSADKGITLNFIYDEKDNLINKGEPNQIIYLDNFIHLKNLDDIYLTNPLYKENNNITKKIEIDIEYIAKLNDKQVLKVTDGVNNIILEGPTVEQAINSFTTKEQIEKCLNKTGNTPFTINKQSINIENNLFIRVGDLNNLRREALDKLIEIRKNAKKEVVINKLELNIVNQKQEQHIIVLARTKEQIEVLKNYNVDIYTDNIQLLTDKVHYRLPRNLQEYNLKDDNYLITSYASMIKYKNNISDYFLNVTNHYSYDLLSKYNKVITLSVECSFDDIKNILSNYKSSNAAIYIYGKVELMMMKSCLLKNVFKEKNCSVCLDKNKYYLLDRNNQKYPVYTNYLTHTSYILNYKNTNLINNIPTYKKMGINNYRIDLYDEDKEQTKIIIENILNNLNK